MLDRSRAHADPAETSGPGTDNFISPARFVIEDVYPAVDGGRFAVKRVVGELIDVWADVFRDGHEVSRAQLLWRPQASSQWRIVPMEHHSNDRWHGTFTPDALGHHVFAIEAWTDQFGTWRRDFLLKRAAGQKLDVETIEGGLLVAEALASGSAAAGAREAVARAHDAFQADANPEILLDGELEAAMQALAPRPDLTRSQDYQLYVDRLRGRAGAWFEIFPRSQSSVAGQHGTFQDCIARLPEIAELGFDVLYFPPIHPIGLTNRKGRNNSLRAEANDPGSPYAIGSRDGGHTAVHPELGTIEDFTRLVAACHAHGLEIALDFAIQCSPDHPWLADHPDWFKRRPDGSIKFAENPPKKYEDIVNPDFYGPDRQALWLALRDIILFWVDKGVRIFRVDNPHTKPFPFWTWMIHEVQTHAPDTIFLAEAFTRPKVMGALGKIGFTQSYTYFTWRTHKAEMQEYVAQLTAYPFRDYYRPNFFVNTPDILPIHLQSGEPWMFKSRVALAATLSASYGVYSGFEFLEHTPVPGKEEYLNSEKYEIKNRDEAMPGTLKPYIGRLNRIRRSNAALLANELRFLQADNDSVIGFIKESIGGDNAVAAAISMAPGWQQFWLHFGETEIGPPGARGPVRVVENLITGERHTLAWGGLRLHIDPDTDPALLFRCWS